MVKFLGARCPGQSRNKLNAETLIESNRTRHRFEAKRTEIAMRTHETKHFLKFRPKPELFDFPGMAPNVKYSTAAQNRVSIIR
jgi:hypothetical protein